MNQKDRYRLVMEYFSEHAPNAETELFYDNSYQLLVAVILSAQCTDKRVNLTTPALFERFPDPASLSRASFEDVFPLVRSISYPNNKARHLIGMAHKLMQEFNGEVPLTVEQLITLPGVGRKTANVITSVIDAQPNMAVDTHVFRVSHRLGLVPATAKTPLAVEKILIKHFPEALIHKAHHWLILHGRYTCTARSPLCTSCGLKDTCRFYAKTNRTIQAAVK